ncbi:MAG: ribosome biogenesis factor YjgA [Pseudomonadota bacterium]
MTTRDRLVDDAPDDEGLSKTRLKKEMHRLQKLGEELIDLNRRQLDALPLPDELRAAIDAAQKMTKHRALYRQRQFIGKVMRSIDASPIEVALNNLRHPERQANARFHKVEHWRDTLVAHPERSSDFITEFPSIDRQQLGQKVRAANKEHLNGKPVGAGKALFRFIDAHFERLEASAE